ncbi:MAG: hypothetical protein AAF467_25470 [Actinomycetota bacterium]
MLPKWAPPLIILFVIFFILNSPETAGPQARQFFGWIGDQASATGTFLDGLFDEDEEPAVESDQPTSTPSPTTPTTVPTTGADQFNTMGPLVAPERLLVAS